jgi:hypothetical protein
MIDPHALRTLIEHWRKSAEYEHNENQNPQYAEGLDDCANELEALLSALPETPWQPIGTAPKDGTSILVWDEGICIVTAWVETDDGAGFWDAALIEPPPQFWMPLPAPPPPSEETA